MRIASGQINPKVGDVEGNTDTALAAMKQAAGADLLVLPELAITGYPPRDLLEHDEFMARTEAAVKRLIAATAEHPGPGVLFGAPSPADTAAGCRLHNSAILAEDGETIAVYSKALLPSYDVFDETRYFSRPDRTDVIEYKGEKLGVTICEDAWNDPELWPGKSMYEFDPVAELARKGATVLVNLSASPFNAGKDGLRFRLISNHAKRHKVPFIYVNQVGGNDDLVFDGRSLFVDASGGLVKAMPAFTEDVTILDTNDASDGREYEAMDEVESTYGALVLGLRDYLHKCGFEKAALGLSGGIDSAVTCAIAAEALGAENVLGVTMPSRYSDEGSASYSEELASNLGVEFKEVPIGPIYDRYVESLKEALDTGDDVGVTFENIQARIRGNILMAISNGSGRLVLATGNKSEMAVGYCTLYGDMCGGLAVIADVPKTMVYAIARHINREREIIPQWIIDRAPSAGLRPDGKDQDTLPPYEVLDKILAAYVERGQSVSQIAESGIDRATAEWVVAALNRNEYKRRQAAPGLRVTSKAFGVGRRIPIAARCEG